jgi:phosphoglycolate phosphatase
MDVSASNCVMVGDSPHDLIAGRLANMRTVAVLTGLGERKDLATLADTVLPDISYLANWISSQNA